MNEVIEESYFREPESKPENINSENVREYLRKAEVSLSEEIKEPPVCLKILNEGNTTIFATMGNFSLVMGKAKSRKTFFVTMALAAATKNGVLLDKFKSCFPDGRNTVIFFDTEQARFNTQRTAKRVCRLNGIDVLENFKVYSLRKFTPDERLTLIEQAIYSTPGLSFIVIDGVRDLVSSINNEDEATAVVSKLLKWTEELNIHILVVLHQNKGNEFARGHLGTELVNKAEIVLVITVDPGNDKISIVEAEFSRDIAPDPFAFAIDESSLPYIVPFQPSTTSRIFSPTSISMKEHKEVLFEVFRLNDTSKYSELITQLKLAFSKRGKNLGDNKAKELIQWYVNERHISAQGAERSPKRFYILNCINSDG